jgi:tetratricopeptide (TPR) repeat protein
MAEETGGPEPDTASIGDPAAVALALGHAGTLDRRAAAYLAEQTKVARAQERVLLLQAEDLKREDKLRHWSLRVRHISDVLKLSFEFGLAAVITAVAIAFAVAVWSAAHENGLVFESLSVPPDFVQRGLTGQVLANQMIDRIAAMRATTFDIASPALDTAGGANALRIQIPDTGISFTELYQIAARKLGHQIPIAGEVYSTGTGITLAIRVSGVAGHVYSGPAGALDVLINRAAADLMAQSEPGRYGVYLFQIGRLHDALAFFQSAAATALPDKLAEIYGEWAFVAQAAGDPHMVLDKAGAALAVEPNNAMATGLLLGTEVVLGHYQHSLSLEDAVVQSIANSNSLTTVTSRELIAEVHEFFAAQEGDFAKAASISHAIPQIAHDEFT